jgi:hypothetical protein
MKKKTRSLLIALLISSLELPQSAHAVSPAPDGGYPGGNTAEGDSALLNLADGLYNTAVGYLSLRTNTNGNFNTALGTGTLLNNTNASENTATGAWVLLNNAVPFVNGGSDNTANGAFALLYNTTGSSNTAIGDRALINNTAGSNNIALGDSAGSAVTTANHVICIGSVGVNSSNSCYIAGIYPNIQPVVGDVAGVTINPGGKLGRTISSQRYKHDIHPMGKASEAILALKPVSFRYNKEYDATQTIAFGLIAEDVAKVNPDLVGRNDKGQPEIVRYEQVNAMLLNEFLKEYRKVQQQEATIAELKSDAQKQQAMIMQLENRVSAVVALIKDHDSRIQKVTEQLEITRADSQIVKAP